ncbi:uncharacterized protein [Physeter macrocephalus]|uniref:Uncharacterized protein n=1 Tax=Physeter macrocephalus TaxID=9755 RepID=A0A455AHR1_PHYMC|nr:uncharacterized protein LOC114484378 [Physeter catodon]|eukprot:XP_028336055.1 uncharacterized protein LOC114484378 isoform X1 [Physeter catodon]
MVTYKIKKSYSCVPGCQPCQDIPLQNSPLKINKLFPRSRQGSAVPATRLHQTGPQKADKHTRDVPASCKEEYPLLQKVVCGSLGSPSRAERLNPSGQDPPFQSCRSRALALQNVARPPGVLNGSRRWWQRRGSGRPGGGGRAAGGNRHAAARRVRVTRGKPGGEKRPTAGRGARDRRLRPDSRARVSRAAGRAAAGGAESVRPRDRAGGGCVGASCS